MASDSSTPYNLNTSSSLLICKTCGTQHPTSDRQQLTTCFICDDPRQYTPPTGQAFTTLDEVRASGHRNIWVPFPGDDDRFVSIVTEPKLGIGQRAILVKTQRGNVLWDCITLLDDETVAKIKGLGGLKAIVISHPHFYSSHLEWARAFDCPVYLAAEDREWLARTDPGRQVFVAEIETELHIDGGYSGAKILKLGGHFPGSSVLLYDGRLLTADTIFTTPAGLGNWDADATGIKRERPYGMNSFAFMWSIPNMIPLSPSEVGRMWGILQKYEFRSTHGLIVGSDILKTAPEMRRRVLESIQIHIRAAGEKDHPLLKETSD